MSPQMQPIGDFARLFERVDFGEYLRGDPPAVLLQDAAVGSFRPLRSDDPRETLFRSSDSGFDAEEEFGGNPAPLPKAVAYMVFPIRSNTDPSQARLMLGCDDGCDVQINDRSVSRNHAWIERRGGEYFIEDNDSTISTYVNGALIQPGEPFKLVPSDQLTLGTVDLIFLDPVAFYHFVRTLFAE